MSLNWLNSKMVGVIGLFVGLFVGFAILSIGKFAIYDTFAPFKPLAGPLVALSKGWGRCGSLAFMVASVLGPFVNVYTFCKR